MHGAEASTGSSDGDGDPRWKELLKRAAAGWLRARGAMSGVDTCPLLILGHMRSGSTLLLHLLIDHETIGGYGERNRPYRSLPDLRQLHADVAYQTGRWWTPPRYVVDQVNHDHLSPGPELIRRSSLRCVFLIRRPGPTVGSLVRVLGSYYPDMTLARAVDHYEHRLTSLMRFSRGDIPEARAFFLTYEELVEHSEPTLSALTRFLDLDEPVDETYRVREHTGRRGDPSETIRAGRIVRDKPVHEVDLDPAVRSRLEELYEDSCAELRSTLSSTDIQAGGARRPDSSATGDVS